MRSLQPRDLGHLVFVLLLLWVLGEHGAVAGSDDQVQFTIYEIEIQHARSIHPSHEHSYTPKMAPVGRPIPSPDSCTSLVGPSDTLYCVCESLVPQVRSPGEYCLLSSKEVTHQYYRMINARQVVSASHDRAASQTPGYLDRLLRRLADGAQSPHLDLADLPPPPENAFNLKHFFVVEFEAKLHPGIDMSKVSWFVVPDETYYVDSLFITSKDWIRRVSCCQRVGALTSTTKFGTSMRGVVGSSCTSPVLGYQDANKLLVYCPE